MVATLGDDTPALSTVQKSTVEFKRERENLEDDPKSGHPAIVSNQRKHWSYSPHGDTSLSTSWKNWTLI